MAFFMQVIFPFQPIMLYLMYFFFRLNFLIIKTIKSHDGKTLLKRHFFSHRQALNYAKKGSRYIILMNTVTQLQYKEKLQLIKLSLQNLALLLQDAK